MMITNSGSHGRVDYATIWQGFNELEKTVVQVLANSAIMQKSQQVQLQSVKSTSVESVKKVRPYHKWTAQDHKMIAWFQTLSSRERWCNVKKFVEECLPGHTVAGYYAEAKKLEQQQKTASFKV